MKIPSEIQRRLYWLNLPSAILLTLLQRTPIAKVVAIADEMVIASPLGTVLRSTLAGAATLGAVHTLAGATELSTSQTSPVSATVGTPLTIAFSITGTLSTPESWTTGGSVPPGMAFSGQAGATLTLSGTPTTAGSYTVTVQAHNAETPDSTPTYNFTINVTADGGGSTAPAITTQPSSQSVTAGANVTFTAAASGSPAPTYQWRKDGNNLSGATSDSLSLTNVQTGDAGTYTVVATNSAGTATSNGAVLTVAAATVAPAITTQPSSQSVTAGANVTFTAAASGNPTPTYQWRKDGNAISGATNATLNLANVQTSDAGTYTVVATNSAGSATSNGAVLTVSAATVAPAITTQPQSQTAAPGASVTFTAAASGSPTPTYQWQKDGNAIGGATNASLSLTNVQAGDAGTYAVVATNSAGSATSNGAVLTVSAATVAPSFTTQPQSQTAAPGGSVTFTAAASGNPAPTYQWRKDGNAISGATNASLALTNVQAGDAGTYTVVATNSAGTATSDGAVLTVSAATTAPTFTTQPQGQTAATGGSATFTVAASGNPAPTYQWYFGGSAISGATSATLTLSNVQSSNAGSYYATATNSAGMATSTSATLTVSAVVNVQATQSQPATTGHDVAIAAAAGAGANLQWQVSTNNGGSWTNLSDGAQYRGTTTNLLEILGATTAMNGYQYRYVNADGSASTTVVTTLAVAAALFPMPAAIAVDASGTVYVADTSANTIQRVSTGGVVTLLAGTAGQVGTTDGTGTAARFNQPGGLVVATDGTVTLADTANGTIRRITAAGAVTTLAGTATVRGNADGTGTAATFSSPVGLALAANGNLYVADSMNHTIRQIAAGAAVTTFAGSAGASGTADGTGTAARFNLPVGVAVDSAGNVYVAETTNNTIRKITPAGVVTTLAGVAGISGAQDGTGAGALFNSPGGLVADAAGNLYVADTGNSVIRKITPAGDVTTLAGLAGVAGLLDGSGANAWFNQPKALALDAAGNLYVADTGNAVIRRVTAAGAVSTLALTAGAPPASGGGGSSGGGGGGGSTGGGGSGGARSGGAGSVSGGFLASLALLWLARRTSRGEFRFRE